MTTNQLLKMCGVPAVMNDIGRIVAVEQADHDVRALVKAYYGAYVTRASVTVMTTTAAHETAEESEWAFNPKDSLALLHAHGMPTDFRDDRRGMQPGTLSIQRRAAAVLAEALDPDVIPF
jgi:L-fucose isomerase-like protein